jgi:hypothetical protein
MWEKSASEPGKGTDFRAGLVDWVDGVDTVDRVDESPETKMNAVFFVPLCLCAFVPLCLLHNNNLTTTNPNRLNG